MARRRTSDENGGTAVLDAAQTLLIEIPALEEIPDHVYCPGHVEVQLTEEQARTLKRLTHTLEFAGAKMANGSPVYRPQHVVAWLLDQVEQAR